MVPAENESFIEIGKQPFDQQKLKEAANLRIKYRGERKAWVHHFNGESPMETEQDRKRAAEKDKHINQMHENLTRGLKGEFVNLDNESKRKFLEMIKTLYILARNLNLKEDKGLEKQIIEEVIQGNIEKAL